MNSGLVVNRYLLLGLILCFSLVNLVFGTIALVLYIAFAHRLVIPNKDRLVIFWIVVIKYIWIIFVHLVFASRSLTDISVIFSIDLIILIMTFLIVSQQSIKWLLLPCIVLFIIDFSFNVSTVVFGSDPFGRSGGLRPGDIMTRLGGLFNSTMYSLGISTLGIFCGLFMRKKWLVALGLFGLLINGTQRAPLIAILILVNFIFLKMRLKLFWIVCASIVFASLVVLVTVYSAAQSGFFIDEDVFVTGNALRVVAWTNALEKIGQSPLFGYHNSLVGAFESMGVETVIDYGIAEAPYLQTALDFGIFPAFLSYYLLYRIARICVTDYYLNPNSHVNQTRALISCVMFADHFYSELYGTFVLTFVFGLICLGYRDDGEVVN